jgi:hypothetical protein
MNTWSVLSYHRTAASALLVKIWQELSMGITVTPIAAIAIAAIGVA